MTAIPTAPKDLTPASRKLWTEVLESFDMSAAELAVLHEALTSLDRARQAADVVRAEGCTVVDRYGSPKSHPACDVEARSRTVFARLVAQLGVRLTVETAGPRRGAKPGPKPKAARTR